MQTEQLKCLLTAEGFEVELVAVNAPYRPRWVRGLPGIRALFRLVPYLLRLWRIAGRVHFLHVMANSGWSWHLFAAPAIWMGYLRGTPVLLNYRGSAAPAFLQRSARWVMPSLSRASRVVVPSAFLHRVFLSYGIDTEIVPNTVDLELFRPPNVTGSKSSATPHLVVTRHLEAVYDNATAIHALHRLHATFPGARLTIAGMGPERESLGRLVETLGLESLVRFSGNLERVQMAELYRSADLLLNPSLEDNTPNSLLEAMASGVPIVTTDVGGIPLLVHHERNGLLVPKSNPDRMAQSAMRILVDAALRERLIRAGLERARLHSWTCVRHSWLVAYAALMEMAPP